METANIKSRVINLGKAIISKDQNLVIELLSDIFKLLFEEIPDKKELQKIIKDGLIEHSTVKPTKLSLNLTIGREKAIISDAGTAITILEKGTGIWNLWLNYTDGSYQEFTNSDFDNGDILRGEFKELRFSNTIQNVTNPSFLIDARILK